MAQSLWSWIGLIDRQMKGTPVRVDSSAADSYRRQSNSGAHQCQYRAVQLVHMDSFLVQHGGGHYLDIRGYASLSLPLLCNGFLCRPS